MRALPLVVGQPGRQIGNRPWAEAQSPNGPHARASIANWGNYTRRRQAGDSTPTIRESVALGLLGIEPQAREVVAGEALVISPRPLADSGSHRQRPPPIPQADVCKRGDDGDDGDDGDSAGWWVMLLTPGADPLPLFTIWTETYFLSTRPPVARANHTQSSPFRVTRE